MAYEKVQYIGGAFDTSLLHKAKIKLKNPASKMYQDTKYKGATETEQDIHIRIHLIKTVLKKIEEKPSLNTSSEVLKVFMVPEFYWQGIKGGYQNDDPEDFNDIVLRHLRTEIASDEKYIHWMFVWGTLISYKEIAGHHNIVNCAIISEGGPEGKDFKVAKKELSRVDFARPRNSHFHPGMERNRDDFYVGMIAKTKATLVTAPTRPDDFFFTAKGIVFGVEICLDHITRRIKDFISTLAPGSKLPQIICIPSCGMPTIEEDSISHSSQQLHLFNVEGYSFHKSVKGKKFIKDSEFSDIPFTKYDMPVADFRDDWIAIKQQEKINESAKMLSNVLTLHPLYGDGNFDPKDIKKSAYLYLLKKIKFSLSEEQLDSVFTKILIILLINTDATRSDLAKSFEDFCDLINSSIDFATLHYYESQEAKLNSYFENLFKHSHTIREELDELSITLKAIYYKNFLNILQNMFPREHFSAPYRKITNPNLLKTTLLTFIETKFLIDLSSYTPIKLLEYALDEKYDQFQKDLRALEDDPSDESDLNRSIKAEKQAYKEKRMEFLFQYKLTEKFFFCISEAMDIPPASEIPPYSSSGFSDFEEVVV